MPPGPGMLNHFEKTWLNEAITKMDKEDQVVAKKVRHDIFELRTYPTHLFASFMTIALVSLPARHYIVSSGLALLSIITPLLYKRIKRNTIFKKLTIKEQETIKRVFSKDF